VLIVEDNADLRESLQLLLETNGHEVYSAGTGHEALEVASLRPPDVVVLDLGLPDMSGHRVAEALRQRQELERTVLIALSGRSGHEEREKTQSSGFDHYVLKPADIHDLEALFPGR
jgi:DNA-binding response OmpR family regulator